MSLIEELEAMAQKSPPSKARRCRVAEALREYDETDREDRRVEMEEALARRDDFPDDCIRLMFQKDGISVFEKSLGPQSVTHHRIERCICFPEEPELTDDPAPDELPEAN